MAKWFTTKPQKLVENINSAFEEVANEGKRGSTDTLEKLSKSLDALYDVYYKRPDKEDYTSKTTHELYQTDFLMKGLLLLRFFPAEQKKHFGFVTVGSIRSTYNGTYPAVTYIIAHKDVLGSMIDCYDLAETASIGGDILRSCTEHESILQLLLEKKHLDRLFNYITLTNFDIGADSQATLNGMLVCAKADSIKGNSDYLIRHFRTVLSEENYLCSLQCIQVMLHLMNTNEFFRDKALCDVDCLNAILKLMSSQYRNLSIYAYQVCRIYIEAEHRNLEVLNLLKTNVKLLEEYIQIVCPGANSTKGKVQSSKKKIVASKKNVAPSKSGPTST